jgi:hypothetical protein
MSYPPASYKIRPIADHVSNSTVVIDEAHYNLHEGIMFVATDLATFSGTRDILITTGSKECHLIWEMVCDGPLTATVYRDVIATASANVIPAINSDHNSVNTAVTAYCYTPTGITTGSDIVGKYFNGGTAQGAQRVGMSDRGMAENILKKNTKYLVRLVTGSSLTVLCRFHWYEVDD